VCRIEAHSTALNSTDIPFNPDKCHCSDDVYWRGRDGLLCMAKTEHFI